MAVFLKNTVFSILLQVLYQAFSCDLLELPDPQPTLLWSLVYDHLFATYVEYVGWGSFC